MSSKEDNPGAKLFQGRLLKGDNYLCGKVDIHYDLHHSSSFYVHMFRLLKIESAVLFLLKFCIFSAAGQWQVYKSRKQWFTFKWKLRDNLQKLIILYEFPNEIIKTTRTTTKHPLFCQEIAPEENKLFLVNSQNVRNCYTYNIYTEATRILSYIFFLIKIFFFDNRFQQ